MSEEEPDRLDKVNSTEDVDSSANMTSPNHNTDTRLENGHKHNNKIIIYIIVMLFVFAIGGAMSYWYFNIYNNHNKNIAPKVVSTKVDTNLKKVVSSTTGEVLLDEPVKLDKQGFFNDSTENDSLNNGSDPVVYYEVGKRNGNTIIMAAVPGMYTSYYLFEKSPEGKAEFICHPSSTAVYNSDSESYITGQLNSGISCNQDIHYDSLSYPDRIEIDDKGSFVTMPTYASLGMMYYAPQTGSKDTIVKNIGDTSIVKRETTNAETKLVSIGYYLRTPLNTMINLQYEPLDLDLAKYRWQSGESAYDLLKAISKGCSLGGVSATRTDNITDSDVQQIGKSGNDLVIYEIKDLNNSLVQKAFTEFKDYAKDDATNMYANMSLGDFVSKYHAVVLYKDVNGQWLVYVREDFSPAYGCAKPVIYLYPTTEQAVNIKIGADVKVSEPYYNSSTGWSVIAKPSGQLTVGNAQYASLFWEGPGIGKYPEITEGTIVKKADAVNTIKKQLAQQGLKNNEINDFVDYWKDKLPNKPYIRLTWFNTSQMNQLAPLQISPKPETLIRVFLDMSGLDKPINIPAQNLKSTPRIGFTAVEWGGLAAYKLY